MSLVCLRFPDEMWVLWLLVFGLPCAGLAGGAVGNAAVRMYQSTQTHQRVGSDYYDDLVERAIQRDAQLVSLEVQDTFDVMKKAAQSPFTVLQSPSGDNSPTKGQA